jgi:hypothetical protein
MKCNYGTHSPLPPSSTLSTVCPQHQRGAIDDNLTLRQAAPLANLNSDLNPAVQKNMERIMTLPSRCDTIRNGLKAYLLTNRTLAEIAKQHSCTAAALLHWVRKLGLPNRKRGRRVDLQPTETHLRVIGLVRKFGAAETARRQGVSRQRISKVVCRWAPELKGRKRSEKPSNKPPPKPRERRTIIISFRLSKHEWQSLQSISLMPKVLRSSGAKKARAIVLKYLMRSNSSVVDPTRGSTEFPSTSASKL